jgi:8-oxo-dGTP diphosphatase
MHRCWCARLDNVEDCKSWKDSFKRFPEQSFETKTCDTTTPYSIVVAVCCIRPMDPPAPFGPGATRKTTVRVGVGVVVVAKRRPIESDNGTDDATSAAAVRVYAGRRIGPAHGAAKLALPGGHLELYETWDQCARREVLEEMGLTLVRTEFLHVTNDIMESEGKHYVTIFMVGYLDENDDTEPINCEPEKCEEWELYKLSDLLCMVGQDTLFGPLEHLLLEQPYKLRCLGGCANDGRAEV